MRTLPPDGHLVTCRYMSPYQVFGGRHVVDSRTQYLTVNLFADFYA